MQDLKHLIHEIEREERHLDEQLNGLQRMADEAVGGIRLFRQTRIEQLREKQEILGRRREMLSHRRRERRELVEHEAMRLYGDIKDTCVLAGSTFRSYAYAI